MTGLRMRRLINCLSKDLSFMRFGRCLWAAGWTWEPEDLSSGAAKRKLFGPRGTRLPWLVIAGICQYSSRHRFLSTIRVRRLVHQSIGIRVPIVQGGRDLSLIVPADRLGQTTNKKTLSILGLVARLCKNDDIHLRPLVRQLNKVRKLPDPREIAVLGGSLLLFFF